jgi:hypothetical protein
VEFSTIFGRTAKLTADNSPAILTGIGVVGVLTTAYFVGKATANAVRVIDEENEHLYEKSVGFGPSQRVLRLDNRNTAKLVWKLYIPAAASAIGTIGCIVCANRIGTRRAAAVAAAYTLSERAYVEYKEKVLEKLGPDKAREIRDDLARDEIKRDPPPQSLILGSGKVLFQDSFTKRYFESTMEDIKQAMNSVNYRINHHMYQSLGDFYEEIGLEQTDFSEEVGWTTDHLMEITFSAVLTEDNRPCISMDYAVMPVRGYRKLS